MNIDEINALYLAGCETTPESERVRGISYGPHPEDHRPLQIAIAKAWPAIYRELKAARAMRDELRRNAILSDWFQVYENDLDAYDAARAETDK